MLAVEPEIIEKYVRRGTVKLVFRDVLNHGQRSLRASEAAACAGRQEKFWHMHGLLFENIMSLWRTPRSDLIDLTISYAGKIDGLDQESFSRCMAENSTLAALKAADAEARKRGITVQPIFQFRTNILVGSQTYEAMATVIEDELN